MVHTGRPLREHDIEAGEMLLADRSAILHVKLEGAVAFVLYDPRRSRAAAGLLATGPEGPADKVLGQRINQHAATLLYKLLADGSQPEDIEIFALGPMFSSGFPGPDKTSAAATAKIVLAYDPMSQGVARRAVFDVSTGRMVLEMAPDA